MHISCSVVCYHNPAAQVGRLLASIVDRPPTPGLTVSIYVVDNSRDDALHEVASSFGAAYIHLPHNPGFGAGHNAAIRDAMEQGCDYHLVVNPDISFNGNAIGSMVEFMQRQRDIGLLMPKVLYPDGKLQNLCKLLPNPFDLATRRFLPGLFRVSGRLADYELHHSGYDQVMDVPALSGCFMLMRMRVLREAGIFDERFFMYLEDVDLTRRIGRISRTVYFPFVSVVHEYGKGSYKSSKLLFHHIQSAIRYFNKWGWLLDTEKNSINRAALFKMHTAKPIDKPLYSRKR